MIVDISVYCLTIVGAVLLIVRGTIFARLRRNVLPGLFGCSQCLGFWAGLAAGGTGFITLCSNRWLNALAAGALVSVCAMGVDLLFLKLGDGPAREE